MEKWLQKIKACEQFTEDDAKKLIYEVRKNYDFNKFFSLPESTQLDYAKKANRLLKQASTPSKYCRQKGLKRSTYHAYRAAFIHVLLYRLETEKEIQSYIEYLIYTLTEQYQTEFHYKPNKARIAQYMSKSKMSEADAIAKDKEKQEKSEGKQFRNSKRSSLKGLPSNWRILIENAIPKKYFIYTMLTHLAGCRSQELTNGVKLTLQGGILTVHIKCAKYDKARGKGIPERDIAFDINEHVRAWKVAKRMKNKEGTKHLKKLKSKEAFRKAYKRAATKALGKAKGKNVSPYSARQQFSADLKYSEIEKETIAYLMGHKWKEMQSHRSQGRYGHKSQGTAGNTPIIAEDNDLDIKPK